MKVAYLFNTYLKNSENWAYRQIVNMEDVEVYIGAFEFATNNFYNTRFNFIKSPFYKIKWNKKFKTPLSVFIINKVVELFSGLYINYLEYVLKREKVDIAHSHFATAGWEYLNMCKRLNIPHVVSFYGWEYEKLPLENPRWKKRYQKIFTIADMIITTERSEKEKLIELGCPEEKLFVGRLGVDLNEIEQVDAKTKDKNSLRLVQIARSVEKKGFIYTVKAFRKALEKCENMTLDLYGIELQTEIGQEVSQYVQNHKLENYVNIYSLIEYKKLYEILGKYDVFIQPSCYAKDLDCEGGAPIALIDAQIVGLPIISTKHCDIPDSLDENRSGFLAEEKNEEELAEFIVRFYEMEPQEFIELSKSAIEFVHREYDAKNNSAKLKKEYQNVIAKYKKRSIDVR